MSSLAVPEPEPAAPCVPEADSDDPEDVATALEAAAVFDRKGDRTETVRWLRRAAESAGESGHDRRAAQLASLAADLSMPPPSLNTPVSLVPTVVPQGETELEAAPPKPLASVRPSPPSQRRGLTSSVPPLGTPAAAASGPPRAEPRGLARDGGHSALRQAARVAARPGDAAGQYVVSLLEESDPVPEGSHEAILVFVNPAAELLHE